MTTKAKKRHRPMSREELLRRYTASTSAVYFKAFPDVPDAVRGKWLQHIDDALEVLLVKRGTQREMVQAFRNLTECTNFSEQLISEAYTNGQETIDACTAVLVALHDQVKAKGYTDSAWTLTGPQVAALRNGRELWFQQLAHAGISGGEWTRAISNRDKHLRQARQRGKLGEIIDGVLVVDMPMPD